MIAELVDTELATSIIEPILAGGRPVEVTRISITYRGRVALERRAKPPEPMPSARYRGPPMTSQRSPT